MKRFQFATATGEAWYWLWDVPGFGQGIGAPPPLAQIERGNLPYYLANSDQHEEDHT